MTPDSHAQQPHNKVNLSARSQPRDSEQFAAIPMQNQSPSILNIDSSRYRQASFNKAQPLHDSALDTPADIMSQASGQPQIRDPRAMQQIGTTTSNKSQIRSAIGSSAMGSRPQVLQPVEHHFITESQYQSAAAESTGRDPINLSLDHTRNVSHFESTPLTLQHRRHTSLTNSMLPPKVQPARKHKMLGSIGRATELKTATEPLNVKLRFNTYSAQK